MKVCNIKKTNLKVFSHMSLLSKNSRIDYLMKIILASFIASIGFITNRQESIIGSMLISPFGGPIMGLVSALLIFDAKASLNSTIYILIGFVIMVLVGMFIGYINRNNPPTDEMKKRYNQPSKWILIDGIFIGIVFSIVTLSSGSAVIEGVGAGIAVALLPPIVNSGLTFMNTTLDKQTRHKNIKHTLFITGANVAGVVIASMVVFSIHCNYKYLFKWE